MLVDELKGFSIIDAARYGDVDAMKLLLKKKPSGVSTYLPYYFGSPLQAAVCAGNFAMVKQLLDSGADINVLGHHQIPQPRKLDSYFHGSSLRKSKPYNDSTLYWGTKTPIQIACAKNHVVIAEFLLRHGSNPNFFPFSLNHLKATIIGQFHVCREKCLCNWSRSFNELCYPALQHSVANGHTHLVRLLISWQADVNLRGLPKHGDTPLQLAARQNLPELVQVFIDHGADVNAAPSLFDGRTALQAASESGNIQIVELLIEQGADVNALPGKRRGLTALQAAIVGRRRDITDLLLSLGADVNGTPSYGEGITAIQAAAAQGDLDLVSTLLHRGAEIRNTTIGTISLVKIVSRKHLPMLKLLVENGANIRAGSSYDDLPPIFACSLVGWMEGLQFLLDNGTDINSAFTYQDPCDGKLCDEDEDYDAIFHTGSGYDWKRFDPEQCLKGEFRYQAGLYFVRLKEREQRLRKEGKLPWHDISETSLNALAWSIIDGNIAMTELLLHHGAELQNHSAKQPYDDSLCLAFYWNSSSETISMLVEHYTKRSSAAWHDDMFYRALQNGVAGAIKLIPSLPESVLLTQAKRAWGGYSQSSSSICSRVEIWLQAGVDINFQACGSRPTLLQFSLQDRYPSMKFIRYLIDNDAGFNVPATSDFGTPLQEAIKSRQTYWMDYFLEYGADINAAPAKYKGRTALQAAVETGERKLVSKLIERGADVNAPPAEQYGATALQVAAIKGDLKMAIELLKHGAHVAALGAPERGRTAIDGAAARGHEDMLQLLLNHYDGCENLSDVCKRAAVYAEMGGCIEVAYWLRNYSSNTRQQPVY